MRHVGHGAHRTMAETTTRCASTARCSTRRGYSFLAVTERATGALVGDGGLHPLGGDGPDVELGYTLARSAWGRGYATELGRALVAYAFDVLGVPRVVAQVEPANAASRHVLEKLGMTRARERTAYGRPHLLYDGRGYAARCAAAARRRRGEARQQRLGEPALAVDVQRRDRAVRAERADPRASAEPVTTASAGPSGRSVIVDAGRRRRSGGTTRSSCSPDEHEVDGAAHSPAGGASSPGASRKIAPMLTSSPWRGPVQVQS